MENQPIFLIEQIPLVKPVVKEQDTRVIMFIEALKKMRPNTDDSIFLGKQIGIEKRLAANFILRVKNHLKREGMLDNLNFISRSCFAQEAGENIYIGTRVWRIA